MVSVTALLKRYFVSGVLVVVPLILTYIVLKFLFEAIDGILQPVIYRVLGYFVPGLGVFVTILLIFLAGVLTRNYLGAQLYRLGDQVLVRVPIIRPVYSAAKQLLEALTGPSMQSFREVALIEYPRKGVWALGFVSNRISLSLEAQPRDCLSVFVPSTPTPVSGMVILVPVCDVYTVNLTVEEGVKFLVSGGVASPALISAKLNRTLQENEGITRETS